MVDEWYWCLSHARAESEPDRPAADRLGPYSSEQAAREHADVTDRRNDEWDAEDRRWKGEP